MLRFYTEETSILTVFKVNGHFCRVNGSGRGLIDLDICFDKKMW